MARGPIIDTKDLAGIEQYCHCRCTLDVLEKSHLTLMIPYLKRHIDITPHYAWASKETRQVLINEIAANIHAFFMVNKELL
jgi:glycerate dehydrogenase